MRVNRKNLLLLTVLLAAACQSEAGNAESPEGELGHGGVYDPDPLAPPATEAEVTREEAAEPEGIPTASPADQVGDDELADGWASEQADPGGMAAGRPASPRSPTRSRDLGRGGPTYGGVGGTLAQNAPVAPLPQNGVLANNFVAGRGAQARLEDLLDRGVMVGGANVRLEAFDELGRLPYPVPGDTAVGLNADLERAQLLAGGERIHMQIALMAHQGEAPPRPRMDIRLVFDRSGSMMGDKWTHAIAAAHQLVDRLEDGDTFGLVSYSDTASLDFRPQRVGNGRAAHQAINELEPGGGTNIEGALALVSQNAPSRRAMNDVLLVVLVSDGVANIGQTNAQELGGMARALFDERGVLTTAVGLGTDFDEETMLSIAREGSGSYHFVRRAPDIGEILTDELEERAQAVAQALRLRIELAPGVTATRVYGSRMLEEAEERAVRRTEIATDRRLAEELGITRDRQTDEDRGLRIHLPTFRRGDQHVVLMELNVPPGVGTSHIAHITLDYKDLLSRGNRTTAVDVEGERTRDREASIASTVRPVKRTVLAFQAGDALRGASDALARGDMSGAQTLLAERRQLLVAASDLWGDRALARDADLLSRYERVLGAAWNGWDTQSRSTMMLAMNFYGDRRMQ